MDCSALKNQIHDVLRTALENPMDQGVKNMLKGFWISVEKSLILVIVCLPILMNPVALWDAIAAGPTPGDVVNCDIQRGPCTQDLAGMTVTLDILPRPVRAMKDLEFRVTVSGGNPVKAAYIDLGMPGMDMGPNRVELRPVKDNVYEGEGIIVRCPSGRRTWKATVTLPESGKVEFLFDVIY
jgi:hypothetical protein